MLDQEEQRVSWIYMRKLEGEEEVTAGDGGEQ